MRGEERRERLDSVGLCRAYKGFCSEVGIGCVRAETVMRSF